MGDSHRITSAVKDGRHLTDDWQLIGDWIDGVQIRDVRHLPTANSITTEVFRRDWGVGADQIIHLIHVAMHPGALSAWHMHKLQTDHIFVVGGAMRLVLFDGREGSPTDGQVDVFNLAGVRPMLLVIPPGVWHGVKVLSGEPASFINFFDRPYDYENPDEHRLPADTPEIPYTF